MLCSGQHMRGYDRGVLFKQRYWSIEYTLLITARTTGVDIMWLSYGLQDIN